jgi:hypothetical protein
MVHSDTGGQINGPPMVLDILREETGAGLHGTADEKTEV